MDKIYEKAEAATDFLRKVLEDRLSKVAIVLGSGLGALADELTDQVAIPYRQIPFFSQSTVEGHAGQLVAGKLEGIPIIAMQGRLHTYEGYDMATVTFPVRVLKALGVDILILTNAAGGLNPSYQAGDLMGLNDHIFLPGMVGNNPLRGFNDERLGTRFPAINRVYPPEFLDIAVEEAEKLEINFHRGVYIMLTGPNFETPAELRFLRGIGADAVGMSTVPEVIVAAHSGMRVLGISTITNMATGAPGVEPNHLEVLEVGKQAGPRLAKLIKNIIPRLLESSNQG
ncbi:purine-nucleoside phosphorylase [Candidatus Chlorohelix allophototropha]|uniref:Purine nucleoside phosphorylase n=1 Tax=Candidatus Chlorohelix allophototropha TaxID=3003348 RepID=A0ABY9AZ14_9CHLR|nr:purine-nucleoside phosphorylase [Chloroflexota bacterium L227-S17]